MQLRFSTFVELKEFIHSNLCQLEQLELGAFPMTERVLKRGERLCGFLFSVHGPRSVVFNAILETDKNSVHFYNSAGERVRSIPLGLLPPISG